MFGYFGRRPRGVFPAWLIPVFIVLMVSFRSFWLFPVFFFLIPIMVRKIKRNAEIYGRDEAIGRLGGSAPDAAPRDERIPATPAEKERAVLSLARAKRGRLTPSLLAVETGLSLADSEEALDELVKRGYAAIDITKNGTIEYLFSDFLPN